MLKSDWFSLRSLIKMRVNIIGVGDCESAKVVRGYLAKCDRLVVSESFARYTIKLEEIEDDKVVIDGIEGELERSIVKHVSAILPVDLALRRGKHLGVVKKDNEILIQFNRKYVEKVEVGIYRGLVSL